MNKRLEECINLLSTSPGCYLMHDKNDKVIYVGKAKNLKNRVSQYFLRPQIGKVAAMASNVEYFETILTKNDAEAFILELNLIHKYMPKYNILLKDDKHYPYIALKKGSIPQVKLLRNTKDKNYWYYGPYPNSTSAYDIVSLINALYPIRKCRVLPKKPCLYYHLGQCLAFCVYDIDPEIVKELQNEIKDFLSGKTYKKEQEIKAKIKEYSEALNFEEAERNFKLLEDIKRLKTNQSVDFHDGIDRDFFAYIVRENYVALSLLIYRNGVLLGKDVLINEIFDNEVDTVTDLIYQYYDKRDLPKEIIVYNKDLFDNLSPIYGKSIKFIQKGKLYNVLNTLIKNATKALNDYFLTSKLDNKKEETLEQLAKILHIDFPSYIELFDNSHISGSDAVGVSVSFINGEPLKNLYRKYHLNNSNTRDDLSNMYEVLYRRYSRMKEEKLNKPDLILLDGGLNQLEVAKKVFEELDISIPVFGLFKNDKHQTSGIIDSNGEIYDIDPKSDVFYLITNMQNEVHRYAITFFKKSHSKSMVKSILDDVEGLGEKRKNTLYEIYKDIKAIENASLEELSQILPKEVAKNLYDKIHKN